jgi:dihydrofolate reductase
MKKPRVSIIAAIGRNRELGGNGGLLWHLPEDFKNLVKITTGKPIIMGSKTYESIGKPLPNRHNIVLSQSSEYSAPGCTVVTSLEEALAVAAQEGVEEVIIFGGGFVYKKALKEGIVDRLYLTLIDADFPEADVFFPEYRDFTRVISEHAGKEGETYPYKFVTLEHSVGVE